jgi:hypothetical protein
MVRAVTPCDVKVDNFLPVYAAPDYNSAVVTTVVPYGRVGVDRTEDGWSKITFVNDQGRVEGWMPAYDVVRVDAPAFEVFMYGQGADRRLAAQHGAAMWPETKRRRVEAYIVSHPELSDEIVAAMRKPEIVLGMPYDAMLAMGCPPTGVEDNMEQGRRIQRLTWGESNRDASRLVVTVEDSVVTGIRRGAGTAEDAYR